MRLKIWEAEYKAIFIENEKAAEIIENEFANLKKELSGLGCSNIINKKALEACRRDKRHLEEEYVQNHSLMIERSLQQRKYQIEIMEALENFAGRENLDFHFIIISLKQFNSGFGKPEFSKISMMFPELSEPCEFGAVSNTLKASESIGENFFYLYYSRKELKKKLHISELIEDLLKIADEIESEKQEREEKREREKRKKDKEAKRKNSVGRLS